MGEERGTRQEWELEYRVSETDRGYWVKDGAYGKAANEKGALETEEKMEAEEGKWGMGECGDQR